MRDIAFFSFKDISAGKIINILGKNKIKKINCIMSINKIPKINMISVNKRSHVL